MMIAFVVNGFPVTVEAQPDESLKAAIQRAFELTKNAARPFAEWELRHASGVRISDHARAVSDYALSADEPLYLTLEIGFLG